MIGANSFNENEINQDHFLETPIPRKVRLKEAEQIQPQLRKLQKQTHSITDLQLEEIKQAEISESQKTGKGNNIIQQTNVQSATEQISANNTTASDPAPPACPTNTTTTLDTSSNSNPVTSSSPDATSIPTAKSVRQSNKCTISLLTFNVEGYRSNKLYLEKISNRADIIFVQEHWLYKHEKHIIGTEFSDFQCHVKSFDEDKMIEPRERTRGHGGVAICVDKKLDQYSELLPDGGNKIILIKLKYEKPLILICAYMPTKRQQYTG
ncbi:Hypothetical predicted protein [Mytilus galloprovincialis]|uniref:Endonuclease/exonuclease/phosphatase domain-containing protein n=1 Tax=Mytilus galloprovincialis TaxID=29158 RepID=A0A8B6G969_MYTGA|nr:Hypothetical predicted protein [Mytilus galloprovincialis]